MAKTTTTEQTAPAEAVTVVFYDDRKGEPAPHADTHAVLADVAPDVAPAEAAPAAAPVEEPAAPAEVSTNG